MRNGCDSFEIISYQEFVGQHILPGMRNGVTRKTSHPGGFLSGNPRNRFIPKPRALPSFLSQPMARLGAMHAPKGPSLRSQPVRPNALDSDDCITSQGPFVGSAATGPTKSRYSTTLLALMFQSCIHVQCSDLFGRQRMEPFSGLTIFGGEHKGKRSATEQLCFC